MLKLKIYFLLPIILLVGVFPVWSTQPTLRILTINVWSGLDYCGFWQFGEYEPSERRDLRFNALLTQIRTLQPDIIFIQEANQVASYTSRLADSLDYDEIHQVCIAGIKFGPLGIPTNFKEGIAILAHHRYQLEKFDACKLSGQFGLFGDAFTIHFDESNFALLGKIHVNNVPIYLVNVHLSADVPMDSLLLNDFKKQYQTEDQNESDLKDLMRTVEIRSSKRKDQVEELLSKIKDLPAEIPIIIAGDFNASVTNPEILLLQDSGKFIDAYTQNNLTGKINPPILEYTWDVKRNKNISHHTSTINLDGSQKTEYEKLTALYDGRQRKIDHIFLSDHFLPETISSCKIVLDSIINDVQASDHFGVEADLEIKKILNNSPEELTTIVPLAESTIEPLPILSYDTDVGFGYGVKGFLLNTLGVNESFDIVLFNSTKGERWYKFIFSIPDFELRQGKVYPFAIDFTVDYDKWIKYSYFGIGNSSRFEDREYYTREPLEISMTVSRGFSKKLVGQIGARYRTSMNFNFSSGSRLAEQPPLLNASRATFTSFFSTFRFDSRNSFINPSRGLVINSEIEVSPKWNASNVSFLRIGFGIQHYSILFDYPKTILAIRFGMQCLYGSNLPIQILLPIGGGNTLRGSPQERYLDKISTVGNIELRFPIFWRFGGVAGYDFGKVWNKIQQLDLSHWSSNPNIGIRFHFDTFIVRADLGLGKETTGFYLNFGHIF
ncbi:MAG: BamA/TamA family outer membrane protein [Ignavibacteriales bacterium]|nr:BamA/TamA family outer membrane protein [Ignavibacteriales bacterium]